MTQLRRATSRNTSLHVRWASGQKSFKPIPDNPTHFDLTVEKLGLSGQCLNSLFLSKHLRAWAERNRWKWYVPEILLESWGLALYDRDMNISGG
jgi:hypothetical protein